MKKLIGKTFLFSALVIIISGVVIRLLPDFWARPEAKIKVGYWSEHKTDYNTVFIGSSRIYHHLDPHQFDSLAGMSGLEIRSFNLGIPSCPFPQSSRMLEAVISDPDVKYIYYELTPVYTEVATELENTPENYYWYDYEQTMLLCQQVKSNETFSTSHKWKLYDQHLSALVEKNLWIGGAQTMFNTATNITESNWLVSQCRSAQGFSSLDYEMTTGPHREGNKQRRINFEQDTSILTKRVEEAMKYNALNDAGQSTPYTIYLQDLYAGLHARGVEIFFVVPPRLTQYSGLKDLLSGLPSDHIIDFSSPTEFPQFYMFRYAFDKGHLNTEGAAVFTRKLFELSLGNKRLKAGT